MEGCQAWVVFLEWVLQDKIQNLGVLHDAMHSLKLVGDAVRVKIKNDHEIRTQMETDIAYQF